jgi:two-component system, NarL family, sensor histidine kinase DegS
MRLRHLISRIRAHKRLHLLITVSLASLILFLYYSYRYSIPTPPDHWLDWFWGIFSFEFRHYCFGLLLNIPILYSFITLGWKQASVISLVLVACVTPYILAFSFVSSSLPISYAILLFPAIIAIAIELDIVSREKERKALVERESERVIFLRQILKAQENERKRLSQELHDGITQTLLVNNSLVRDLIQNRAKRPDFSIEKNLKMIENNSQNIINDIRRICRDLRPSQLDNLGLVPAIKWLIDSLHNEKGIEVNFIFEGSIYDITPEESVVLFRLVQETLTNIRRHAEATTMDVSLKFLESGIYINIKDNGKGFELPNNINNLLIAGKLGIAGMYERAQSIGATLQIDTNPGSGTVVNIMLEKQTVAP